MLGHHAGNRFRSSITCSSMSQSTITWQRAWSVLAFEVQSISRYRLESLEAGTLVTLREEGRPRGCTWLIWPLAAIPFIKQWSMRKQLSSLKAVLESLPPSFFASSAAPLPVLEHSEPFSLEGPRRSEGGERFRGGASEA